MWEAEKRSVLETAQKMAEQSLIVGTAGNVSLRIDTKDGRDLAAISPSSMYYDTMTIDDISVVDFDGQTVDGERPTSIETMLHLEVYKQRKKMNAVIHYHPEFASVVGVIGQPIPPILDDQVQYLGGQIELARYEIAGSQELVETVIEALGPRNAVILPNHGAIAIGRDMKDAFTNCKMLEKTSKIFIHALSAGKINLLPKDAFEAFQIYFNYQFGED